MSGDGSLVGLLAEHGIRPQSFRAGHTEHLTCPKCGGGSTKEKSLALTMDEDGEGAAWVCHRGTCGWRGGERRRDGRKPNLPRKAPPNPDPPSVIPTEDEQRTEEMYRWWELRGVGRETVNVFGIFVTTRWFPKGGEQRAMVFPYLVAGRVVNRKYRSADKQFVQDKNPLPSLFNIDAVTAPDVVVWCEGEPDVLALHEAGYPQSVTLANGAPAELRAEDDPRRGDDKRFEPLRTHADLLNKVKKFILAGDNDAPGLVLREELARRLGRHRCWLVEWPEGCKDPGDVLRTRGPEALQAAIEAATPYPIAGIRHIDDETLLDARYRLLPPTMTTGALSSDRVLHLPTEGKLIIITGYPSSGKSRWLKHIAVHTMAEHNRRWLIFSPEMQPWGQFAGMFAEAWAGKPFYPSENEPGFSREEVLAASAWLRDRLVMLVTDSEDVAPTLDWILECAQAELLRTGITDLQIDPWNEIEHSRGSLTEAEYINRGLQRCKAFALRHGVNVWIVVHPSKPQPPKPGETLQPPTMYDINGGAAWNNKADLGLVVHTPKGSHVTQLLIEKSRFHRWGLRGTTADVTANSRTGRYTSTSLADELAEKFQRENPGVDHETGEVMP